MVSLSERVSDKTQAGYLKLLNEEQRRLYLQIPEKLDYVDHPSFSGRETEGQLFGQTAPAIRIPAWTQFPEAADEVVPRGSSRASLRPKDEVHLFLRYNYARYRLHRLARTQRANPTGPRAVRMVQWYKRILAVRSDLVGANMALVLAMAKRTRVPNVEFSELISEGNLALLRAVDKFDVSRGFKLSTYACRAILKAFNRLATKTGRYRQHFPTEFDPELEQSDYDVHKHEMQSRDSVDALREILARNRASLSEVERTIVMERFAIGSEGKGRTLTEVGKIVGLTNERVRQIQNLALGKIRAVLDEEFLAA